MEAYDRESSVMRIRRTIRGSGLYDGLKVQREPGDQAITELRIGEWCLRTSYYSRDGRYKGTYINLNTPVELCPGRIRYVDLEVDICVWPDGRVRVLDMERLRQALEDGLIGGRLVELVEEKVKELVEAAGRPEEQKI